MTVLNDQDAHAVAAYNSSGPANPYGLSLLTGSGLPTVSFLPSVVGMLDQPPT